MKPANDEPSPAAREAPSPSRARIRRMMLTDFRSYARAELAFDGRPVVIAGANGAGKTNLLEAISLIGPGRGLRGARLDELPRIGGAGGWAVAAQLDSDGDESRVGVGVGATADKPNRRVCRIDDTPAAGPGAFAAHLRCVWLTPAMDRLFMDGAGERRRFIDRMTLARDAAHSRAVSGYEQAMRQRQKLLEDGGADGEWLAALERQMSELGVAMALGRTDTLRVLEASGVASDAPFFPAADLALKGVLEEALKEKAAASVERDFAQLLAARRRLDAEAGRALLGPHRSDLSVVYREKNRPAKLCSTGEQKALLIGLVLSNARALAARRSGAPLFVLLDEIAAHLDPDRRAALFSILAALKIQAFMTGTDQSLFNAWGDRAQFFEARDGALFEQSLTE